MINIISIIRNYINSFLPELLNLFFAGNVIYFVIFIVTMSQLSQYKNELLAGKKLFFNYTIGVLFLTVLNPFFVIAFMRSPSASYESLARFWLLCPTFLLFSFVFCILIISIKRQFHRFVALGVLLVLLFSSGNTITSLGMINSTNNIYKIRSESIVIADRIITLCDGAPTAVLVFIPEYEGPGNFVDGGTIASGIMQYTGLIDVHTNGYTDDTWHDFYILDQIPGTDISTQDYLDAVLSEYYRLYQCEFVIIPDDECMIEKMHNSNYELVDSETGYYIYQRMNAYS